MDYKKRDKNLVMDYVNGMSLTKLVIKYKIGYTRIYHILDKYDVPRRSKR